MTTHARYERAAQAAFDHAYPAGYGEKLHVSWDEMKLFATTGAARQRLSKTRAKQVVTYYRELAQKAIEA